MIGLHLPGGRAARRNRLLVLPQDRTRAHSPWQRLVVSRATPELIRYRHERKPVRLILPQEGPPIATEKPRYCADREFAGPSTQYPEEQAGTGPAARKESGTRKRNRSRPIGAQSVRPWRRRLRELAPAGVRGLRPGPGARPCAKSAPATGLKNRPAPT